MSTSQFRESIRPEDQAYINLNTSADTIKNYALYVSEPISCHQEISFKPLQYDEFSCFEYFLNKMKKFDLNLILRSSSEERNKYNSLIRSIGANIEIVPIKISRKIGKSKDCSRLRNMAMSIAEQLTTYTSIDPAIGKPRLPNKNKNFERLKI